MEFKDVVEKIGVDWNTVIARFSGNAELFQRFMLKFSNDQTFADLDKAVREDDFSVVESSAHTLKGLSANLGLDNLSRLCAVLVKDVREKDYDIINRDFDNVKKEYENIVKSLETFNQ